MIDETASYDPSDPDDELLAEFIREIERQGPADFDPAPWTARSPHLAQRFRQTWQMYLALEGSRPESQQTLPTRLGEFRIVRRIAGHLGDVYEAVQEPLGRRVAVKTIRQGRFSPELQARFLREQQVLASLHQTHIIPIHTAGVDGSLQFFAMPYIEGAALHHVVQALGELQSSHPGSRTPGLKDLARVATKDAGGTDVSTVTRVGAIHLAKPNPRANRSDGPRKLSTDYVRSVARVMADVADAVHHAHQKGILHRDIKPSNIMVDTQEQSWIIDFGLARYVQSGNVAVPAKVPPASPQLNGASPAAESEREEHGNGQKTAVADEGFTKTAGAVGTPTYMAPEQFEGEADVRTDVWGLGATLYELLTLARPFTGSGLSGLKHAVRDTAPVRPRTLVEGLPADMEAICLKAMQKDPARRYQTSAELADDLRRWLRTEPTEARPARTLRRITLWGRRNPGWAIAIAVGLVAFAVLWAVQAVHAESQRAAAVKLAQRRQRESMMSDMQRVRLTAHRAGWSNRAFELAVEASKIERDDGLRAEAAASLAGIDAVVVQEWNFRSSSAAFNPDGTRLLIGGGIEGNTRLWLAESDSFQESKQPGFGPVAFKPDGDGLHWAIESPWSFVLWNVSRQQPVCRVTPPLPDGIQPPDDPNLVKRLLAGVTLAISRDGTLVAASVPIPDDQAEWHEDAGATFVWNDRGELVRRIDGAASGLCFSPDNALLAVGRANGRIDLVSLQEGRAVATLQSSENRVHCFDFFADPVRTGEATRWLLAAGDAGSVIVVWDVAGRFPRARCLGSPYDVYAVAFSPDGMTLASGGREGARLWESLTGKPILHIPGTGDFISGLAFSADGAQLAVASQGWPTPPGGLHTTTVHSVQHGRGIDLLHGLSSQVVQVCLSEDGRLLAALGQNWEIGVFQLNPPRLLHLLQGPVGFTADNAALAISADNRQLAASSGSEARLWNLETGTLAARHKLPPGLVDQLAFTPDGMLLSFRSECRDGRTAPMGNAHPQTYPRVLRLRNLLGEEPLKPLAEIPRFNWHVFNAVAHPHGTYFIADGLHRAPDGESQEITAFDGRTGEVVWSHSTALPIDGKVLVLDPTGSTLGIRVSDQRAIQVRIPTGEMLPQSSPLAHALGPNGDKTVSAGLTSFDGRAGSGIALLDRDSQTPTVVLGIDFLIREISPRFSRDGRRLVFGTREGLVAVCDLPQIERRLADFQKGQP